MLRAWFGERQPAACGRLVLIGSLVFIVTSE